MSENNNLTIALLIDAENVSYNLLDSLEEELTMLGRITIKKCYGDFSQDRMKSWDSTFLNKHSIEIVQQHAFTNGKNSSDIRLAIDAMDILYEKNVNAICIMSSDSDFTGLAIRLRQSNVYVWGAGEEKTPQSFINACDRFFTLKQEKKKKQVKTENNEQSKQKGENIYQYVEKLLLNNYDDGIDSGHLVKVIRQRFPDFDWKIYGASKFPDFISKDVKERFTVQRNKDHSNITILLK